MVNIKPLSQIPLSPSPPAFTDTVIGVQGGTTDLQYTLAQIGQFNRLTAPLTLYVRTQPVVVTLSNGSPCVAHWPNNGLQFGDPVVFSSPYDFVTCTISIASPGVVTAAGHTYANNDPVSFDTSGALPTGLAINTIYFAVNVVPGVSFQVAATPSGSPINTSGSQSGQQYAWRNNSFPTGVIDGAIYFVASIVDPSNFTFSKTVGGAQINTTTAQVGKIIASTGNDNNSGLTQTRSGALMTVGKAWRLICGFYNLNSQIVTVQCAHGTYYGGSFSDNISGDVDNSPTFCSNTLTAAVAAFWLGAGEVLMLGDAANPDAVKWLSSTKSIDTNCDFDGNLTFKGFRLENNGSAGFGTDIFQTLGFNTVVYDTIVFGNVYNTNTGAGIKMDVREGTMQLVNPCRVYATAGLVNGEFILAEGSGTFFKNDNTAGPITGINNPTMVAIFQATDNGLVKSQLTAWQGNWNYNTMAAADVQGVILNHNSGGAPNPTNTAVTLNIPVVNDRAFFLQFQTPTQQDAAMHGVPGVPVDLFYLLIHPTTGFSQPLNNSHGHVILDPAGTLATGTITMSPNPWYGSIVNVQTSQTITAMTFAASPGQTLVNAPTTLSAGQRVQAFFDGSPNNKWYFTN